MRRRKFTPGRPEKGQIEERKDETLPPLMKGMPGGGIGKARGGERLCRRLVDAGHVLWLWWKAVQSRTTLSRYACRFFLQLFTILQFGIAPCWVKLLKTVKKLLYTG